MGMDRDGETVPVSGSLPSLVLGVCDNSEVFGQRSGST